MLKPDITFSEVSDPPNRWCDSGHVAPEQFARGGPDDVLQPTRFFRVYGKVNGDVIDKTICEPCSVIVNFLAARRRKARM
jgi:hypothetical protein